jgi:hypothetical protein
MHCNKRHFYSIASGEKRAASRSYFLPCVAAATANKHCYWYSMARSQIRPRIGVRCGPKVWHYPAYP